MSDCHDCGVPPGTLHEDGCDTARCLVTGLQRLTCDRSHEAGDLDCGRDIWTGQWPGAADAIRLGWLRGGRPDLNRLVTEARWNRGTLRWEAP